MKVQDLLKLANIDEQVRLTCEERDSYEEPYNPRRVKEALEKFIKALLEITSDNSSSIIVFEKYWDSLEDEDIEMISPECYHKEDIERYLEDIKDKYCPVNEYDKDADKESLKILAKKFDPFPVSYAFEFTEWETVLGWDVYIGNLEELGLQKCIHSILYEMSFNGMTREEQEERREELDKRIKEFDEIKKLPKEAQEEHFITFEEMKEHWKKEFGWEEPSKEEMEEEERKSWLSILKTSIWRFENFKNMNRH